MKTKLTTIRNYDVYLQDHYFAIMQNGKVKASKISHVQDIISIINHFSKVKAIILLLVTLNLNVCGQKEDVKYASFNILSGGITSSAIACFNKPKGQKLGKTFIQSFWKGCLGGSLNYTGKKLIQISAKNNTYAYVWPGRIVNSLGSSIVYNGANNEKLLHSVSMNVFFTRLSYDGKLHCQIDVITLGYAGILSFKKNMNLNFKNTILTGSIFFNLNSDTTTLNETEHFGISGETFGNTFYRKVCKRYVTTIIDKPNVINQYTTLPFTVVRTIKNYDIQTSCHEIIHTFQYEQFSAFNILSTDKICNLLKTNLNNYLYINPNFELIYSIGSINKYSNNPFEKEAYLFGQNN
jgi:hypothetical protein